MVFIRTETLSFKLELLFILQLGLDGDSSLPNMKSCGFIKSEMIQTPLELTPKANELLIRE